MKMDINWHQECLKNKEIYLSSRKAEYARMEGEIKRLAEQVEFYINQIELAKRKGLLAFDRERMGMKRKEKQK